MLSFAPMPLLDDFLIQYNLAQAVLLLFILSLPAGVVQGSRKITAINAAIFGVLFITLPSMGAGPVHYAFLGIILLVFAPMWYVMATR